MPFYTRPGGGQDGQQQGNNNNPVSDPVHANSQVGFGYADWTSAHRPSQSDSGAALYNRMSSTPSSGSMTSVLSPFTMMQQQQQPMQQQQQQQQSFGGYRQGSNTSFGEAGLPSSSSFGGFPSQRNDMGIPQTSMLMGGAGPSSFSQHRRMETAPTVTSPSQLYSAPSSIDRDESANQFYAFQQQQQQQAQSSYLAHNNENNGPLRVHQFFPTMGETGVPVTFLITVKTEWARNVGLQLADRRASSLWSTGNRPGSHLVVSFGNIDVETRTERSMAGIDGSFSSWENQQQLGPEIDLTVIAQAPPYPGSPLPHPSMGGKVPVYIKLSGSVIDPTWQSLLLGIQVGEFCYWQVSPRSNLKRAGAQLVEHNPLRRPASFPSFGLAESMTQDDTPGQSSASKRRGAVDVDMPRPSLMHHHRSTITMGQHQQQSQQQGGANNGMPFNFTPDHINFTASSVRPMAGNNAILRSGGQASQDADSSSRPFGSEAAPPALIRSSQLANSSATSVSGSTVPSTSFFDVNVPSSSSSSSPPDEAHPTIQRATLNLHGNLHDMALGWSHEEWKNGRRLVQFWRKQEGATIHAVCKPILPEQYIPNTIVVSCIFWEVTNECYITSVDIIYLLEALVASRFNVEEKNRIRRNLEGLKPKTISKIGKSQDERVNNVHEKFFKLVMSFSDPRPRHIEKDIKIFPWRTLAPALNKILSKYSAAVAPSSPAVNQISSQQQNNNSTPSITSNLIKRSSSKSPKNEEYPSLKSSPSDRNSHKKELSIDVAASNGAFSNMHVDGPSSSSSSSNQQQQHQQHLPSLHSSTYLSTSSPRKATGNGGPAQFNFSDFVVSPVAFGQTPLQQSQQSAMNSNNNNNQQQQQYRPSPFSSNQSTSGLGMDLGLPRRD